MHHLTHFHYPGIYVLKEPAEAPAFAYIRMRRKDRLGFSVLDNMEEEPDFSNCGVFWVKPEDFFSMFKNILEDTNKSDE